MHIHSDFDATVCVRTDRLEWQASPMVGVDRRMLDRIGDEVARATSIVRYAKGSAFPEHTHSGGEEFIVLDGVFQDEHGDYPAGTYVRNPVGTHHIPRSDPGCTIFVKLWQFDPNDQEQFAVDLNTVELTADPVCIGVHRAQLASRDYENVALERWDADTQAAIGDPGGFEILILEGSVQLEGETYSVHNWIRWPAGQSAALQAGEQGARFWIKRGHLSDIRIPNRI
ncbi:MAG: cupin domain-containing protein [Erythrobacter sp.]